MDDQVSTVQARGAPVRSAERGDGQPPTKKKKYVHRDQYALPDLDTSIQDKATLQDPRLATEEELREFIEDIKPEDFDVDGDWFNSLSTELKYEIIGDLRLVVFCLMENGSTGRFLTVTYSESNLDSQIKAELTS